MKNGTLIWQLASVHYYFLSLWPGHVSQEIHEARLYGNRLTPIPFRTHGTLVRTTSVRVRDLIGEAKLFFQHLDAIPAFQLDPATEPADFATTLTRFGYRKQVEEAWMVCSPLQQMPSPEGRRDTGYDVPLHIHILDSASSPDDVQAYIDCYNRSFHTPARIQHGFGESFKGVLSHAQAIHYLARLREEPAGALSLFYEAGYGCIYNVGTFPGYRGLGVATALLRTAIDMAAQLNVHTLFLQAVHNGPAQPLYQRLGFQTQFLRQWYLPDQPGGIWSDRGQSDAP